MSTIDTSTWSPDSDLNVEIEGIPLNSNASIAQTWQALRALMAAVKGDGDAIKSMIDVMQGATASADGASGLVPKPEAGDQDKVLRGDGTWGTAAASSVAWSDVTGKPSSFTPSSHTHGASDISSGTIDAARLPISSGAGWLRLPGNIQICWGEESISGNPTAVTYAKGFSSRPATTVTPWHSSRYANTFGFSSTGFDCRIRDTSDTVVTSEATTIFYIAIGTYTS